MTALRQMTTLRQKIGVMTAYANGSLVQRRRNGIPAATWEDVKNPKWSWGEFDYRVKKSVIYLLICRTSTGDIASSRTFHSEKEALEHAMNTKHKASLLEIDSYGNASFVHPY